MNRRLLAAVLCLPVLFCGCAQAEDPVESAPRDEPIVVGFSQVGAESEWRVANTESMKAALSEENGYELFF